MARKYFAMLGLALAAAAPLGAQVATAPAQASPAAVAAPAVGPTYGALTTAAHAPAASQERSLSPAMRGRAGLGQSRAMMIVGVGALLAGAVIGGTPGTIIMIGGAVVGLVGLYDYLQ